MSTSKPAGPSGESRAVPPTRRQPPAPNAQSATARRRPPDVRPLWAAVVFSLLVSLVACWIAIRESRRTPAAVPPLQDKELSFYLSKIMKLMEFDRNGVASQLELIRIPAQLERSKLERLTERYERSEKRNRDDIDRLGFRDSTISERLDELTELTKTDRQYRQLLNRALEALASDPDAAPFDTRREITDLLIEARNLYPTFEKPAQ